MNMKRRIALAGTATMAGLTLAACGAAGGGSADKKADTKSVRVPVAATAPATAKPAQPQGVPVSGQNGQNAGNWKGWLALSAARNDILGTTVVNGKGFTLYRFDKDTAKPPVSNCFGACAKLWPPVKFTSKMKLAGIPRSAIGNIMTKDGICQATVNGWPIYTYAKDTGPGRLDGQGVGGTWFAVAPDGSKAGGGRVPTQGGAGGYQDQGSGGDQGTSY